MRSPSALASIALLTSSALCQSPKNYTTVSTDVHLGIGYDDSDVIPNAHLNTSQVAEAPSVYTNDTDSGTYLITLIDVDVPDTNVTKNESAWASLAKGIATNRTTRLHWFEGGVKKNDVGIFKVGNASTEIVASYEAPNPAYGEAYHTYVLFLWNQPDDYKLPKNNTYGSGSNSSRYNFSVSALEKKVGPPVAANYFRVNGSKPKNTTAATSAASDRRVGGVTTAVAAGLGAIVFALLL